MIKALLVLVFTIMHLHAVSYKEALDIPSVAKFSDYTGEELNKHLAKAIKNKHWQEANAYLYNKTIKKKYGIRTLKTIPFYEVMQNLKSASEEGILLATFQGYDLSSIVSGNMGSVARKHTSYFSRELMSRNVCLGYVESSYSISRGWNGHTDWNGALRVIKAGEKSCNNEKISPYIRDKFKRYRAQFSAMSGVKK